MGLVIKVQVWRGDTILSDDVFPVQPGLKCGHSFGLVEPLPVIEGEIMLYGYVLEPDACYLNEKVNTDDNQ
jgi:hypothetical protein